MANLVNGLGGTSGFGENSFRGGSSSSINGSLLIDLSAVFAGGLNFEGTTFTSLWLNENGNVTFGSKTTDPRPTSLPIITGQPFIAPFWADVDTRIGGPVWWDIDPATRTFTATWDDVGRYDNQTDLLNAFQLQIVAIGTTGEFDIHFRYETLQWVKATSVASTNARAGYSSGNGDAFFEFTQSGTAAMANLTGLSNVGEAGHFVFAIRDVVLFTSAADAVDFNNLTADQKTAIIGGSNIYDGLGGSDTVILPDPANYDQVVGKTKEGVDIKLGWTDTAASTFHTGSLAGHQYSVQASDGDHFIVTGAGDDTVNVFGSGDNKITVGGGNATILIDVGTTNGSNTIVGGSGNETITLRSGATTDGTGTHDISVGAGSTRLTVDGRFLANVHGGTTDANRATFDLISIDDGGSNNTVISLDGYSNATSVRLETDSPLLLKPGAFLKADVIKNTNGTFFDPGMIIVEAGATLEIGTKATGAVRLGSGSSTLILDDIAGVSFTPDQTETVNLTSSFSISNIAFGDSITLRGLNVPADPVIAATLGMATLKDSSTQLALRIETSSELRYVAVDKVNGSTTWDNQAYFKVAESADGNDTVLTLVAGNNFADSMGAALARQRFGVDGTGIKIGIISDSFRNNAAGYQRDLQLGVLPNVTILSDYVLSSRIDEGRAMAHIIHAIAPGASLYFSTVGATSFGFSTAVSELIAAGCNIIVDDVSIKRILEAFDGSIEGEINHAVNLGVTFVTAAGNDRLDGIRVYGHAALSKVISVASVNVLAAPSATSPNGQYLPAETEPNSSEGKNGKPDLSGPDRGQTAMPLVNEGLNPFPGTSAAAPAVAAVAALMLQYNPLLASNPGLVQILLEATSYPFGQPVTAGAGFVQAVGAIETSYDRSPAFYVAPGNAPFAASLAAQEGLSATPGAQLKSAALSTGPGSASSDQRVLLLLTMDQGLIVTGAPSLTLNTGGLAIYDPNLSTPSAGRLLFEYTVGATEQVSDLRVTGLAGSIKDGGGNAADLSPVFGLATGLTINSPLKVQAVTSTHAGVAMAGETIEVTVTLSSGVTLDTGGGAPTLALTHGATALYDAASSSLAAGKLVFDYKVGAGEATPDVSLASIDLPLGTWLRDASGNNADLSLTLDASTGVQVGPAFVVNVFPAIEQTALPTGQTVDLTIVLSQGVVVDRSKGSPTLALSNGAAAAYDLAASDVSKGILVFEYKAVSTDAATDNLMITKVALNGATIRDTGGLDADLTGAQGVAMALTIHSPLSVDTTTASKSGTIQFGDSVQLTITMEESLQVIGNANSGGPPTLALNDGGTAFYDAVASDLINGKLVFDYKVGAAAHDTANLAITRFDQNGAILIDSEGNFADLSGALNVPTGIQVDVPDQATVAIATTGPAAAEGQGGTTAFTFMVTLDRAAASGQSVKWSVAGSGSNPAAASDFAGGTLPSGTLSFAAGEIAKTVAVNVLGDAVAEADESFIVTLSNPSAGLTIGTATAAGTIQNDDAAAPPTAYGDAFVTLQGKAVVAAPSTTGVLANDLGGPLTASHQSGPTHGSLLFSSTGGFTYTPHAGYSGIDSFTYRASNGTGTDDNQATLYVVPVSVGATTTLNLLALTPEEQIAATYAAFFGRGADAAGFTFWVSQFNAGLPVQGPAALFANIASSFGISDEARTLYPFLVSPFGSSDAQIAAFIDSVYNNLFNRSSDAAGLNYWTGQVKQTLAGGQFVGSVLVNIMSGAQDTVNGKDITTLMGKVAVSLDYVQEQQARQIKWAGASDAAAATALLDAVTSEPQTVLTGIRNAEELVATHL